MMQTFTQSEWIAWGVAGGSAIAGGSALFWGWWRARRQRERLRVIFDRSPQPMIIFGEFSKVVAANREACRLYGYQPGEWQGLSLSDLCRTTPAAEDSRVLTDATSDSAWDPIVWSHRRKDGEELELEVTGSFNGFPDDVGRMVVLRDVTEVRREAAAKEAAEEALRHSENRYRQLVDGIDVISWEVSLPDFVFTFVSEPAERILGYPVETWYQRDFWTKHVHPDDLGEAMRFCTEATGRGEDHTFEYRMIAADGRHVWIRDMASVVTRGGKTHSMRGAMIDITAERLAHEELAASKRRYLAIVDAHPDLICRFTIDCKLTFVNGAYAAFFGHGEPAAMLGKKFLDFLDPTFAREAERQVRELAEYPGAPSINEQVARGSSGDSRRFSWHNSVVRTENGKGVEFQGVGRDVTALMNMRDAVVRRDTILRTVAETVGVVLSARRWEEAIPGLLEKLASASSASCMCLVAATGEADPKYRFVECWSAEGVRKEEYCGMLLDRITREPETGQSSVVDGRLMGVPVMVGPEPWGYLAVTAEVGRPAWTDGEVDAIRSFAGLIGGFIQRERMTDDLRSADEQLRQSQKLEAVGQLASGVAHDFNNLLTAIQGYVGLAKSSLATHHPAIESLEQVEEASRQATGVANALLTFTRRGSGQRRPVELASVIEPALKLLRRTLPASVDLRMEPTPTAVWVDADATQMQQVILNLAINARDSMPEGGNIRIRIESSIPSKATIVVSDNGCGMTEAVRTRAFEPFFTTKPKGSGTGLGLAIVHGIVTGHGGGISVQSSPGAGTEIRVTLPTVNAPHNESPIRPVSSTVERGRVLVLEDDQLVRGLVCSLLNSLGYDAVAAATAADANQIVRNRGPFAVVLVDIELPDENGLTLLASWRAAGMTFPAVIITGRADVPLPETMDAGTSILQKPFRMSDLREVLATVMAGPAASIASPNGSHS